MIGRSLIGAGAVWASAEEFAASTIKAAAGTASTANFATNGRSVIANTPPAVPLAPAVAADRCGP
jgi:hypothetical protein